MNDITFIIPTIGRKTLQNALQSIINQTNDNWKIIIIFDGIEPTIQKNNDKITIIKSNKKGKDKNSAGNVRNYGMEFVNTKWIAFLDDDDVIANNYVETFNNEIKNYPNIDLLIFRMLGKNNHILPPLNTDNFYINNVGISFALKTEIYKNGHKFIPSNVEDFNYLDLIRKNNYKIMISPYVKYFVNYDDTQDIKKYINNYVVGNRIFINKNEIESFVNYDNMMTENYVLLFTLFICAFFILTFAYSRRLRHDNILLIIFLIFILCVSFLTNNQL